MIAIMNPVYNIGLKQLQAPDIQQAQTRYGAQTATPPPTTVTPPTPPNPNVAAVVTISVPGRYNIIIEGPL